MSEKRSILQLNLGWFSNLPIRSKFLLTSIGPLLLLSAFILIYYPKQQKNQTLDSAKDQITKTAKILAISIGSALESGHFKAIEESLNWTKSDEQVVYILITDSSNSALANYQFDDLQTDVKTIMEDNSFIEKDNLFHAKENISYLGHNYGKVYLGYKKDKYYNVIHRSQSINYDSINRCAAFFRDINCYIF